MQKIRTLNRSRGCGLGDSRNEGEVDDRKDFLFHRLVIGDQRVWRAQVEIKEQVAAGGTMTRNHVLNGNCRTECRT